MPRVDHVGPDLECHRYLNGTCSRSETYRVIEQSLRRAAGGAKAFKRFLFELR